LREYVRLLQKMFEMLPPRSVHMQHLYNIGCCILSNYET